MKSFFSSGAAFLLVAVLCMLAALLTEMRSALLGVGAFWLIMAAIVRTQSRHSAGNQSPFPLVHVDRDGIPVVVMRITGVAASVQMSYSKDVIRDHSARGTTLFVYDLTDVPEVSSTILGLLTSVYTELKRTVPPGGRPRAFSIAAGPHIERLYMFRAFRTLPEAIRALRDWDSEGGSASEVGPRQTNPVRPLSGGAAREFEDDNA